MPEHLVPKFNRKQKASVMKKFQNANCLPHRSRANTAMVK